MNNCCSVLYILRLCKSFEKVGNSHPWNTSGLTNFWISLHNMSCRISFRKIFGSIRLIDILIYTFWIRSIEKNSSNLKKSNILSNGCFNFNRVFFNFQVFCSELPVFLREHFNGMYRTDVYFLCKTFAELPVFVAIPILFTCVTYYIIGLNPGILHFLICVLVVVLVSTAASSFGRTIRFTPKWLSFEKNL